MDSQDLINFNSPLSFTKFQCDSIKESFSPGKNPFDDILRLTEIKTMKINELIDIDDGRESLGILSMSKLDDFNDSQQLFQLPNARLSSTNNSGENNSINIELLLNSKQKLFTLSSEYNSRIDSTSSNEANMAYLDSKLSLGCTLSPIATPDDDKVFVSSIGEYNRDNNSFSNFSDKKNTSNGSDMEYVFMEAQSISKQIHDNLLYNENNYTINVLYDTITPPELLEIDKYENCQNSPEKKMSPPVKEILDNLFDILSNDNINQQQKVEGQNLLTDLANILNDSHSSNKISISNHSSFNDDRQQNSNITDLKIEGTNRPGGIADLIMKRSPRQSLNRRMSQSFSFPKPKPFSSNKKIISGSVNLLNNINDNKLSLVSDSNTSCAKSWDNFSFKTKKPIESNKKIPLKAVLPLSEIVSTKAKTPIRNGQQQKETKIKINNTPVNTSKIKPVAQSTPNTDSKIKKRSSSPLLNKPVHVENTKTAFCQRRSLTNLKKPTNVTNEKYKPRSYSAGKEPKILLALNKARESIKAKIPIIKSRSVKDSNKENFSDI